MISRHSQGPKDELGVPCRELLQLLQRPAPSHSRRRPSAPVSSAHNPLPCCYPHEPHSLPITFTHNPHNPHHPHNSWHSWSRDQSLNVNLPEHARSDHIPCQPFNAYQHLKRRFSRRLWRHRRSRCEKKQVMGNMSKAEVILRKNGQLLGQSSFEAHLTAAAGLEKVVITRHAVKHLPTHSGAVQLLCEYGWEAIQASLQAA